jgi:hypothetical protein
MHPRPDDLLVLLAGIALLLAGRRLFWLFVGVVGFFAGLRFALQVLGPRADLRWIVALAAGLLGIVLAIALQRLAVALAGFFVGGYVGALRSQPQPPGSSSPARSAPGLRHRRSDRRVARPPLV